MQAEGGGRREGDEVSLKGLLTLEGGGRVVKRTRLFMVDSTCQADTTAKCEGVKYWDLFILGIPAAFSFRIMH